jgi:hypothetical protein
MATDKALGPLEDPSSGSDVLVGFVAARGVGASLCRRTKRLYKAVRSGPAGLGDQSGALWVSSPHVGPGLVCRRSGLMVFFASPPTSPELDGWRARWRRRCVESE